MNGPHDVPTASELLDAVREWIETDLIAAVEGRTRFHARVAANVLGIVGRELDLGPEQARRHAERLAALGVADDVALAAAIRSGGFDDRLGEIRAVVRESVVDKLAVANPGHLVGADRVNAEET